jgi:aldose 1-epimerase
MPDRDKLLQDIVLGYDDLASYEKNDESISRIPGRTFWPTGSKKHPSLWTASPILLPPIDGPNHLHGGLKGFNRAVWLADPFETAEGPSVRFYYLSLTVRRLSRNLDFRSPTR